MTDYIGKITQKDLSLRPEWIRGKVSWNEDFRKVSELLQQLSLNSVCVSAACPNKGECWEAGHVTFMILGKNCTRACRFCNVEKNAPCKVDHREPENIAEAVKKLGAEYAVITSVSRDDLPDKGMGHFVRTVSRIKANTPQVKVELLIPDMDGDAGLLEKIAGSGADVIGHNIEMPEALYPELRPESSYRKSLQTLSTLKEAAKDTPVKSSFMLGLGETEEDIFLLLQDLKDAGVDIVYAGQYLSPSRDHWPVRKYYGLEEFKLLEERISQMGFGAVLAGPMVRSSFRAHESYLAFRKTLAG
jgi:lipoic acid synthetase